MTRASIFIVIVLVCLNAAAAVVGASGVGADLGIDPSPGGGGDVQDIKDTTQSLDPDAGIIESFVGLSIFVFDQAIGLLGMIFAGPTMISNLGVPGWLTSFIFAPMYIIVFADSVYIIAGRLI